MNNSIFSLPPKRKKAQSMVEFALVLPILLLLVLGIFEYGRLFFAWISIENAARIGARYASTGRYDEIYCTDIAYDVNADGLVCEGDAEEIEKNNARVLSIKDEASGLLFGNPIIQGIADAQAAYFNVTVCSGNTDNYSFTRPNMGGDIYSGCQTVDGTTEESAGQPGERVIVSVDYNFPFIVTNLFGGQNDSGYFHLGSYKEATVEQFRVSRVVNIGDDFTLPDLPTPTPQPTPTPDCSVLQIDSFAIHGDDLRAFVSNNGDVDMPLSDSVLTWEYVGGYKPYIDYFEWSGRTYYKGNDYTSPTSHTCAGRKCDFPGHQTYLWSTDFDNATDPLFGEFDLELTFANFCKLTATSIVVPTPAPDCSLLEVQDAWYQGDDFRVKVKNNNPIAMPLTNASLSWPQDPPAAVINYYKWNWKTFYPGNTKLSPYSAACVGDICDFGAFRSRTWLVDFNKLILNRTTGAHEVTLTFADLCDVPVSLAPDCSLITITRGLRLEEDGEDPPGNYIQMGITNNNPIPLRMDSVTVTWPSSTTTIDGIWQGTWSADYGWQEYTGDWDGSYSSPATYTDPMIFEPNETYWWATGFSNPDPYPMFGDFGVTLNFEGGTCTLSDTLAISTATPTPPADCDLISLHDLRVGSSPNHYDDDNIQASVTNNNPMPMTLTDTTFYWTNPYNKGVDFFTFGGTNYYSGNSYSSPTIKSDSTVEIPANTTYTWNTDFTDWSYPLYGSYSLELVFDAGPTHCELFDSLEQPSPTPTFTPTITYTPSNTPSPTATFTPSPTIDCNLISSGNAWTSGDDVRMNVTNNNPHPIQLTFTNFTWSNYYGNGVNWFSFGGTKYYGGDDYSSPTTASASVWIPAGATFRWVTDFTSNDAPIYGPFAVDLTFDGRCHIGGSVSHSTPTPSYTPSPTYTPTFTPTPTHTRTPTKTFTPTKTYTPSLTPTKTDTPVTTPTFTPTPSPTEDWD